MFMERYLAMNSFISQTQTYDLLNHLLKSLHACSCWAQTIWLSILDGVAKEWLSRTNNTSSPSHTQIHTDALLGSPLMPMGAQLLPGSYSLCLLPGTQLRALGLPCSVLEQKSWMSSDGPADGVVFFSPLTLQLEREGFSSPWACLCLHVFKQSSFDKFPPLQELFCCPLTAERQRELQIRYAVQWVNFWLDQWRSGADHVTVAARTSDDLRLKLYRL